MLMPTSKMFLGVVLFFSVSPVILHAEQRYEFRVIPPEQLSTHRTHQGQKIEAKFIVGCGSIYQGLYLEPMGSDLAYRIGAVIKEKSIACAGQNKTITKAFSFFAPHTSLKNPLSMFPIGKTTKKYSSLSLNQLEIAQTTTGNDPRNEIVTINQSGKVFLPSCEEKILGFMISDNHREIAALGSTISSSSTSSKSCEKAWHQLTLPPPLTDAREAVVPWKSYYNSYSLNKSQGYQSYFAQIDSLQALTPSADQTKNTQWQLSLTYPKNCNELPVGVVLKRENSLNTSESNLNPVYGAMTIQVGLLMIKMNSTSKSCASEEQIQAEYIVKIPFSPAEKLIFTILPRTNKSDLLIKPALTQLAESKQDAIKVKIPNQLGMSYLGTLVIDPKKDNQLWLGSVWTKETFQTLPGQIISSSPSQRIGLKTEWTFYSKGPIYPLQVF